MDYASISSGQTRPPLHMSASSNSLSRISCVSDITDFENYVDDAQDYLLREQPSLVSLQSDVEVRSASDDAAGHRQGTARSEWSSLVNYAGASAARGYEQLGSTIAGSPPTRTLSRTFGSRGAARRQQRHDTVLEHGGVDDVDLGLIRSAAPMGATEEDAPHDGMPPAVVFDLTSALGPSTLQDEEFVRELQQQEAKGVLTGGLGRGIKTESIITESALLAASPIEKPTVSRAFSISRRLSRLSRSATLKQLAQIEANKRGEVIEVIMEVGEGDEGAEEDEDEDEDEDEEVEVEVEEQSNRFQGPEVDLSVMAGANTPARDSTRPKKAPKSEVFYPQPNWKPFSMRWPYLMSLIILSMGLAGVQEVTYQTTLRQPLLTFHAPSEIPPAEYFAIKFLPTLITVSYGVLWQLTDFEVRRLEAFYQLSKENGALAAESINVNYITNFNLLQPVRALYCRHYAVFVSSIATLLATAVVPTLGAAAIYLAPDAATRLGEPDGEKQILISAIWSRFLTITLLIIALLGCVLFSQLQSRKSGLLSDPLGIAGLASMAVVSHILMDFKDMDVASPEDIHRKLKRRRYVLRNSSLAPADNDDKSDNKPPSKPKRDRYVRDNLSQNPHPLMLRAEGCVPFLVGIALFLALIPTVLFTPAQVLTDRASWVMTALAVCIKLVWSGLETDVRMMEPYYLLARRHAPPRTLALDYTAMPFGLVAVRAALNRHTLVALIALGSIMAEMLTVLVTSLATVEGRDFISGADAAADAGVETPSSFWVTLALTVFILLYMGLVAAAAFARRRRAFLPRQPNTVAGVLAFIHQSKMLYDFVDTATLTNVAMVARLERLGKTYGLGWFRGRDGHSHCGVDEEELLSGYKAGYDYAMATKPWEEQEWL